MPFCFTLTCCPNTNTYTHTRARTHAHTRTHTADRLLYTAANRPEKIFLNLAKRHFLVK